MTYELDFAHVEGQKRVQGLILIGIDCMSESTGVLEGIRNAGWFTISPTWSKKEEVKNFSLQRD